MRNDATTILESVQLTQIWRILGGGEIRRGRSRAFWRNGDGWNVSLDDKKGSWCDYARGERGGIIDLVIKIHGGSRQDALRWVASIAGIEISDRRLSASERVAWAEDRRSVQRYLPAARLWRRAAVDVGEGLLTLLKAALFDPMLPPPDVGEIAEWEGRLSRWRRMDGRELVAEYQRWSLLDPEFIGAIVKASKLHEVAERRACDRLMRMLEDLAT
jgi:hypothetical protein